MTMNIYLNELKSNIHSVITWSISLFLLTFILMSIYPGFAKDAEILNDTMAKFPEEFLMAFGMNGIDLSTVLGFFGLLLLFCQICVAIQAANYGFALVSAEERDLIADFLLSKPVGRTKILTSKLLAALTSLAMTNIVIWICSLIFINTFRDGRPYETRTLVLLLLTIAFMQMFFFSAGLVISLLMRKVRNVTPLSMGLVFGLYVISAFGGMIGEDKWTYITPFKHFDANYIVRNAAYDVPLVLISVSVIVISVTGSYLLYAKRDIHSV
jgi:ABC-2 type transport system permease protein